MINNQNITHKQRLMQSLFLVPQQFQLENIKKLDAEMAYVSSREAAQNRNAIAVDRNRLVKRGESPTDENQLSFSQLYEKQYKEKKTIKRKALADKQSKKAEQHARIKNLTTKRFLLVLSR